jgi:hypothetical protein
MLPVVFYTGVGATGMGLTGSMRSPGFLRSLTALSVVELVVRLAASHYSLLAGLEELVRRSLISFSTPDSVSKGVTRMLVWLPRDDRRDSSLGCDNAATSKSSSPAFLCSLLTLSLFKRVSSPALGALPLDCLLIASPHVLVLYTPATIVRSNLIDLCIVVLISKFIILN